MYNKCTYKDELLNLTAIIIWISAVSINHGHLIKEWINVISGFDEGPANWN